MRYFDVISLCRYAWHENSASMETRTPIEWLESAGLRILSKKSDPLHGVDRQVPFPLPEGAVSWQNQNAGKSEREPFAPICTHTRNHAFELVEAVLPQCSARLFCTMCLPRNKPRLKSEDIQILKMVRENDGVWPRF